MTLSDKYFATDMKVQADQKRLSLQEQAFDPFTIRNLETIGVAPGWNCLEVGAGYGSITSWLAERVGSGGRIIATDIRPELHRAGNEIVEIRQHDILKDDLENNHYDLVHSRMLLQHLPDPETALNRMAEAVKPGGWLFIEEIDNAIVPPYDSKDTRVDFFYRATSKYMEIAKKAGGEVELGRKVRFMLEKLGFNEIVGQGNTLLTRGGEPWATALIDAIELLFNRFIALQLVDKEEVEHVKSQIIPLYEDPTFYFVSPPLCCAWGRKPK